MVGPVCTRRERGKSESQWHRFNKPADRPWNGDPMAYPHPVPALRGKPARELDEDLEKSRKARRRNKRWEGSRETYEKLRPKSEED